MSTLLTLDGLSKLSTTFSLSKLQAVPQWNAEAVVPAPHSGGAGSAASSTRSATNRTIDRAEPCFITNVSAYTHEQAHLINAVGGTGDKQASDMVTVQDFLIKQGIVGPTFLLDDACNLVNMDPWLHSAMDKYAMFAVTCSHKCLDMYIEIIKAENAIWLTHLDAGRSYVRKLKALDRSVLFSEYELVVLRPEHFLPDNSLLPFYPRGPDGRVLGLHLYEMSDRVLRKFQVGEKFPWFKFKGLRTSLGNKVNPYLVILAAEIKFRRYRAANGPELPEVYQSLMDKTIEVAKLLYFQPAGTPAAFQNFQVDMEGFENEASFNHEATGLQSPAHYEFGGSTPRQARQPATGGGQTRHADADYWRHMLSGRDLELNDDDLDLLREIEGSNRAALTHGQSVEQINTWRETVEV